MAIIYLDGAVPKIMFRLGVGRRRKLLCKWVCYNTM